MKLLAIIALAIITQTAYAESYWDDCNKAADSAHNIAKLRDIGIPMEVMLSSMNDPSIPQPRQGETMQMIRIIYDITQASPEVFKEQAYKRCIQINGS